MDQEMWLAKNLKTTRQAAVIKNWEVGKLSENQQAGIPVYLGSESTQSWSTKTFMHIQIRIKSSLLFRIIQKSFQ